MKRLAIILFLALSQFAMGQFTPLVGIVASKSGGGQTYLLDGYANVWGAWSLRKIKSTGTKAVNVRRDSDNAFTDVFLDSDGSQIDLNSSVSAGGTLGSWAGSANVYIYTWYDQSGNGYDQTALSNSFGDMHKIISLGTLITDADGITFGEGDVTYTSTSANWSISSPSVNALFVAGFNATGQVKTIMDFASASTFSSDGTLRWDNFGGNYRLGVYDGTTADFLESALTIDNTNFNKRLWGLRVGGGFRRAYLDGGLKMSSASTGIDWSRNPTRFGTFGYPHGAEVPTKSYEAIIFDTHLSDADFEAIEDDQELFYSAYTPPDITDLTYTSNSLDVSGTITTNAYCIRVGGGKMFIGNIGNIFQYTLDESNVSNSTYDSTSWALGNLRTFDFRDDGTDLFTGTSTEIYSRFDLGSAYSIASVTDPSESSTLNGQSTNHFGVSIPDGGDHLYLVNNTVTRTVLQYDFGTSYNASTLTYSNNSFDHSASETSGDVWVSRDGTRMITVVADGAGAIEQYTLSTPFNVSTASLDVSISLGSYYAISFDVDEENRKIYMVNYARSVREFTY